MFDKKTSTLAAFMACALLCGLLVSCAGDKSVGDISDTLSNTVEASTEASAETDTTDGESAAPSETAERKESEEERETVTERQCDETVEINYNGNTADIVELGSVLSNKVQSYYQDGDKDLLVMENANTIINYNMNKHLYVRSIADKSGNAYIENTVNVRNPHTNKLQVKAA